MTGTNNSEFGQFCPIALASEILTQKWMLLIVRELNAGSTRFSEIRRGVPRISATLLKQRLDQLEHAGVITRSPIKGSTTGEYVLSTAGKELKNVLSSIGEWGQRWARDFEQDDLDPGWLVWAMHRRIDTAAMPSGRTVLEFEFSDAPRNYRLFWFVCDSAGVEVCVKPAGFDIDLRVVCRVQTFAEIWRGIRPLKQEIANGRVQLEGSPALKRAFPKWLLFSVFANTKRQRLPEKS
jgi:DNA-binding HxlR family transcriptional regulator